MKTSAQKLAMVFIFFVQSLVAQDSHEKFESTFSNLTINQVLETLKIKKRYAEEFDVQVAVDDSYTAFQANMQNSFTTEPNLSDEEINGMISLFLNELGILVSNIDKTENEEGPTVKSWNGPCVNMDLEAGDLSGWTLSVGETDGSVPYSYVNAVPAGPGPNHLIVAGGADPIGGFPRVNPDGGSFSVRLGNGAVNGAGAARMSQSFLVDASNVFFTYSYAVVFQSPDGHSANERPYFTVRVYDEFGGNITCGEYSVIADAANAADYQSVVVGGNTVLYKDWTTVFTNLSAYIGQNVTIEFTSGDCSLGGHYGYAYVDASCSVQQITASDYDLCPGETSILTAPAGIANYLWSTGETTQAITVNSGGNYTCLLTPLQGPACAILLDITINDLPQPNAVFTLTNSVVCFGLPVDMNDNSTIAAPGTIATYEWNFGDGISTPATSGIIVGVLNTNGTYTQPQHDYLAAGVYNITLNVVSADGCSSTITHPVTVNPTPVVVAGVDQTVCEGTAVTLSGAGAVSYTWDNGITNGVAFTPAVGMIIYTVTGTNASNCESTDQVTVTVNPLPIVNAGLNQTLCFGEQVTLSGAGATIYTWDNGISDGVAFTPAVGTVVYTVTGTDANGCESTDQVQVSVNPLPNVGAGVDQVVCSGEQVTLNGSGASTYTWDNGITNGIAFTPAVGTVVYTVTGTDANGCEATDQVQVSVIALPLVSAGNDQISCVGPQVVLAGSGANTYSWDNGVADGVGFSPAVGTLIYTVTGTDLNGCENTDQVQITINPLPNVVGGGDVTICSGSQVTFSGAGASTYTWDNGILDGIAFTPGVGTVIYTVTGTDLNGCENSDHVELTVNALPVVNAGPDQTVCQGTQVVLSAAGAQNYSWDNGVLNGIAFTPAVGTIVYTVTGTDVNGCEANDQVQVVVNALPNVQAGNDQTLCAGIQITLSALGATTYTWNNGITNGVPFMPNLGTSSYTVSGTDANGCENTDLVNVTVNPNPNVNAGNDLTVCQGTSVTLTAIGATNYNWDNGVVNGVPFIPVLGTVVYTVNGSFNTGCNTTDQVTVTVHPNPVVTTHNAEICLGDSVVLKGQGADAYIWTGGVVDNVAFFPTASEDFFVAGYNLFGCSAVAVAKVIVHELPIASFNMTNTDMSIVSPSTQLMNTSYNAVNYTWDFGDGTPQSFETSPFHEFPSETAGSYTVKLTATSSFGCIDSTERYIEIKDELIFYVPNAFTPDGDNYNNSFSPVFAKGFDPQNYTLYIFNRWGEIVFESHDTAIGWNGNYGVNGDMAQDGVYSWKILVKRSDSGKHEVFLGHVSLLR